MCVAREDFIYKRVNARHFIKPNFGNRQIWTIIISLTHSTTSAISHVFNAFWALCTLDLKDSFGSSAVMTNHASALVLFSGGMDSSLCLADALNRYERVETIGFDYGQRHNIELACRLDVIKSMRDAFPQWSERLGEDHIIHIPALTQIGGTALIGDGAIQMEANGLPSTFVPGRNLLFFTYAAALAYRRGISTLIGGMCETDYSGYPDCRRDTLDALEKSLNLGMEYAVTIETPLMYLSKADSCAFGHQLGGDAFMNILIENSHSCYLGDRSQRHDWGYGCGACPACDLRKTGFEAWSSSLATVATKGPTL